MGFIGVGIPPSIIHPVRIVIERLDLEETEYDEVYREPVSSSAREYTTPVTVFGQIHWKSMDTEVPKPGGQDADTNGHITLLRSDVENILVNPLKYGDRIIEIDGVSYADKPLFIVELMKAGHYTTSSLWKFYFSDRRSSL